MNSNFPLIELYKAAKRIAGKVNRTPLLYSHALSQRFGCGLYLKMECWQRCGCFKVRGAVNFVSTLTQEERQKELVTCSSGNHGTALSYAAGIFGCKPARVFVPEKAGQAKVDKIRLLGGEVTRTGKHFLETYDAAMDYAEKNSCLFVHSHDHPLVIAGQGTIGLEILEDLPDAEAVVVPVGGGGLVSGIMTALKSADENIKVYGVESAAAPGAWLSMRDGRCHERIDLKPSIADGLSGTLTPRTFSIIKERIEAVCLVEEQEIIDSLKMFLETEQLILEGSAAVGLAALLSGKLDVKGKKTVLVLTGRNIQAQQFMELVKN